ncbi:MAG: energy-coupled thiamine transporter ThiT [Firmicutes bacterium]|nr:energy-coupled thiamine transporter ThiT [Bacillota bacterium]
MNRDTRFTIRIIVEAGMMLALTVLLGQIKLWTAAYGGSVTAGSMIPLLLLAMLRGPKVGIIVGAVYGVLNYLLGGWFVHPMQWLLDYPLAFAGLGVAGFFWLPALRKRGPRFVLPVLAAVVGIGLRLLSHFLAGIWFWGHLAPEGMPVWVYSLVYNAQYLVPEVIVSAVLIIYLAPTLTKFLETRV